MFFLHNWTLMFRARGTRNRPRAGHDVPRDARGLYRLLVRERLGERALYDVRKRALWTRPSDARCAQFECAARALAAARRTRRRSHERLAAAAHSGRQ